MEKAINQKLVPSGYYHIYNRGNNKENLFKEVENYDYFLSLWIKHIEPVAQTFCYCLLPDHFHFFIRIKEEQDLPYFKGTTNQNSTQITLQISKAFSNLFNAYAKAINKKHQRTGSLFQERFKRKKIEDNANYTAIIGYIITNAVKHNLCSSVESYLYSAYATILSEKPTRLLRNEVLEWFGGKDAFIAFIKSYEKRYAS